MRTTPNNIQSKSARAAVFPAGTSQEPNARQDANSTVDVRGKCFASASFRSKFCEETAWTFNGAWQGFRAWAVTEDAPRKDNGPPFRQRSRRARPTPHATSSSRGSKPHQRVHGSQALPCVFGYRADKGGSSAFQQNSSRNRMTVPLAFSSCDKHSAARKRESLRTKTDGDRASSHQCMLDLVHHLRTFFCLGDLCKRGMMDFGILQRLPRALLVAIVPASTTGLCQKVQGGPLRRLSLGEVGS